MKCILKVVIIYEPLTSDIPGRGYLNILVTWNLAEINGKNSGHYRKAKEA